METQFGLVLCMKLSVFYLEHDRLDDALDLFQRLEHHRMMIYRLLGRIGRGMVLALQSRSQESNELFREVYVHGRDKSGKQRLDNLWREEKWRYWMRKALHYNRQNGVKLEDIPSALHKLM